MSALNAVAPFDWATFFHARLDSTSAEAPMGGIENGGWKVEFNSQPAKSPEGAAAAAAIFIQSVCNSVPMVW